MKKVIAIFSFSFLALSFLALVSPTNAFGACGDYTTSTSCAGACSGSNYACKWLSTSSSCVDSTTLCGGTVNTGSCPAGTYQSNCLDHYNGSTAICDCYINGSGASCSNGQYANCSGGICNGSYNCAGNNLPSSPTATPYVCPAQQPSNLQVAQFDANTTGIKWTPATGGTQQLIRIGANLNEVNNGCPGTESPACIVKTSVSSTTGTYTIPVKLTPGVTYYVRIVNYNTPSCYADTIKTYVPPVANTCQTMYYCDTSNYSCQPLSAQYDSTTHIQCGGTATCEQNIQTYLSSRILPNAQCYTSLSNCSQVCIKPTPIPTASPTPSPVPITARCVSTNIYSPNWTLINASEYYNLSDNSQVYFCTAGSSTAGSFDMARFTINGTLYPNTTVKRTGSNDFCQLYTIPKGSYTTNVQGEIHHTSLGWL